MSGDFLHPLMCSQGGIPYNREHIEYWQAKAAKYAGEIASLEAQLELSRIQAARLPISPQEAAPDPVREALVVAKDALTKIRACSIKGAEIGYTEPKLWADDLYASHGDVARALKAIDAALSSAPAAAGEREDARRYRRLRLLGCAPVYTSHLEKGEVMRFTNLDEFVDDDLKNVPSRGEANVPSPAESVTPEELEKLISDRSANRAADAILAKYDVRRRG